MPYRFSTTSNVDMPGDVDDLKVLSLSDGTYMFVSRLLAHVWSRESGLVSVRGVGETAVHLQLLAQ